jgi:serine phosphatase RsbU (regulator of sigma subunit)
VRRLVERLATRLWPEFENTRGRERAVRSGDLFGVLYAVPMALLALVWLILVTDLSVLRTSWLPLLVLFALVYALRRLDFISYTEIERGVFASFGGSAEDMVRWPAVLMFGPTALWIYVFWRTFSMAGELRRADSPGLKIGATRSYTVDVGGDTLAGIVGLMLYYAVGGTHPPAGLSFPALVPAILATAVRFIVPVVISMPYLLMTTRSPDLEFSPKAMPKVWKFMWVAATWPLLVAPFTVFAAGLYAEKGIVAFLFIIGGTLFASALAHRMSRFVELSTERRREMRSLVQLGWAVADIPPGTVSLETLLDEYARGMFAMCTVSIRLFPDRTLLSDPEDVEPPDEVVWDWLMAVGETLVAPARHALPWGETPRSYGTVLVPIQHTETGDVLGGIAIRKRVRPEHVDDIVPAAESLATQIASVLHGEEVYEQAIHTMLAEEELAVAADMQASLMPSKAPEVPGWEFKAIIDSARQASGDFVDLLPLTEGKWGILVADVAGKGVAAALYMAMVRTLIRTYAFEYECEPARVLESANRRILTDTRDDSYVTAFYAVLEPATGRMCYANAGHNAPYLFRVFDGGEFEELHATGIPLGMLADTTWEHGEVTVRPGDRLLAYTDGATDAVNADEEPFGERRLLEVARNAALLSPIEMRTVILDHIKRFVGEAEQEDDITIMIVARDDA